MRLLRSISLLATVSVPLLFSACAKNPKRAIVGKWQGPAPEKKTMEFFEDGSFVADALPRDGYAQGGKYNFLSDGRLKQEIELGSRLKTSSLAFEKDTMTVTSDDEKKEKIVYTKVKP